MRCDVREPSHQCQTRNSGGCRCPAIITYRRGNQSLRAPIDTHSVDFSACRGANVARETSQGRWLAMETRLKRQDRNWRRVPLPCSDNGEVATARDTRYSTSSGAQGQEKGADRHRQPAIDTIDTVVSARKTGVWARVSMCRCRAPRAPKDSGAARAAPPARDQHRHPARHRVRSP